MFCQYFGVVIVWLISFLFLSTIVLLCHDFQIYSSYCSAICHDYQIYSSYCSAMSWLPDLFKLLFRYVMTTRFIQVIVPLCHDYQIYSSYYSAMSWLPDLFKLLYLCENDIEDYMRFTRHCIHTPDEMSVNICVRMILKTAWDRLLSLFILVAATVLDLFPSLIKLSISWKM